MRQLTQFRKEKDAFFAGHYQSPLTHEQRHHFQGLGYFPEKPGLVLEVDVEEFPEKQEVKMQTPTGDIQ